MSVDKPLIRDMRTQERNSNGATAVSKYSRQKDFPAPQITEDTSSKPPPTFLQRVMLITPQQGTAHAITSITGHLFLEKTAVTSEGLSPRFFKLLCNTARDDLRPRRRKIVDILQNSGQTQSDFPDSNISTDWDDSARPHTDPRHLIGI